MIFATVKVIQIGQDYQRGKSLVTRGASQIGLSLLERGLIRVGGLFKERQRGAYQSRRGAYQGKKVYQREELIEKEFINNNNNNSNNNK